MLLITQHNTVFHPLWRSVDPGQCALYILRAELHGTDLSHTLAPAPVLREGSPVSSLKMSCLQGRGGLGVGGLSWRVRGPSCPTFGEWKPLTLWKHAFPGPYFPNLWITVGPPHDLLSLFYFCKMGNSL